MSRRTLRTLKKQKIIIYTRASIFIGSFLIGIFLLAAGALWGWVRWVGAPDLAVPQTTVYLGDDEKVIGETHGSQKRYWVPLEQIAPELIQATIAVEDKHFYSHHGFDGKRIIGAALSDLRARAKVQGASTISQQYSRNLYLGREKTWKRKWKEALYTMRLEGNYSKDEILEGYLNTIYYGHGMYGIQAASHYYFHKDAAELTLAEAALLAGIPKGPGIYSPVVSKEQAESRQHVVLYAMEKSGFVGPSQKKKAMSDTANLRIYGSLDKAPSQAAPYFLDAVNKELRTVLKGKESHLVLGGLKVHTTLSASKQRIAEAIVKKHLPADNQLQVALIATEPKTGKVKALIGGRSYEASPFNRATQAIRQPGSTIKPILYYTALEKGFTPSTTMRSEVTTFSFDDGKGEYTPHNYNDRYANDAITMAQALAVSDNIFAVKTHLFLGESELVKAIKRFGLSSPDSHVPSLALGTSGVRPIDITNAYNYFANGGKKVEPYFITKVEGPNGDILYERPAHSERILDAKDAFVMTQMLTGIFDKKLNGYASVTGSTLISKLSRTYAGKSGSTDTDSWMIGYTPQLTAGVWTGYDHSQRLETRMDQSTAKEVWAEFMEKAHTKVPVKTFNKPKGVVGVYVDPVSGLLADSSCPVKRMTYFKKGTEPVHHCPQHPPDGHPKSEPHKQDPKRKPWYKKVWPFL